MKLPTALLALLLAGFAPDLPHVHADPAPSFAPVGTGGSVVQSLDGQWDIAQDLYDAGRAGHWCEAAHFPGDAARTIQVPGNITEAWPNPAPLLKASNLVWYRKSFPSGAAAERGIRRYLRFGAVRYLSEVWLNGIDLGSHEGGDDPFEFDVTPHLLAGRPNVLIVRVYSPFVGGIDQHVSLVSEPEVRIVDGFARPDREHRTIRLDVTVENNTAATAWLDLTASLGEYKPQHALGSQHSRVPVPPGRLTTTLNLPVAQPHPWSLEDPFLYTVKIASSWDGAPNADAGRDQCSFRTGFRDFRIVNGYFQLNGKRIFLKSTHMGWYDPVVIQGTPRTMEYLNQDIPKLKAAGFNAMRFLTTAALPEQLDQADELGMLMYSEHESSWALVTVSEPSGFGISLNQVVRRDRNHPSLAMWGLLNETSSLEIFRRAKEWLPSLRAIDDTRLVMLSSGRWDNEFKTGSASNPGSSTWNVYLGGENPDKPATTGHVAEIGAYHPGTGDAHIYNYYPTSWSFASDFAHLAEHTRPFFLSEAGIGDIFSNVYSDARKLKQVGAPDSAYAWQWIKPVMAGLSQTWSEFGLAGTYASPEEMLVDSARSADGERALWFNIVRSNPKVNGYSLTSEVETWGAGEGILDTFREYKPGLLPVLQAGWAPLRWCLFVNPAHGYTDRPIRVKVALANEDTLAPGTYAAELSIAGPQGTVWKKAVEVRIAAGRDAPLAYAVFEDDLSLAGLTAGTYRLSAVLANRPNAAADAMTFTLTSRADLPHGLGPITLAAVDARTRAFLIDQGAQPREYREDDVIDREVIIVGDSWSGSASAWRKLYGRVARGASAVFLSPKVFHAPEARPKWIDSIASTKWLALPKTIDLHKVRKGLVEETEWLYHKEVVATHDPAFAGMPAKLMRPEFYGDLLAHAVVFDALPVPESVAAVGVRCSFDVSAGFNYSAGLVLGTYRHHAGQFALSGFDLSGNLGNPAADRLLLNLIVAGQSRAQPAGALPAHYEAELDTLGITDDL